jgi:hypothetical protein
LSGAVAGSVTRRVAEGGAGFGGAPTTGTAGVRFQPFSTRNTTDQCDQVYYSITMQPTYANKSFEVRTAVADALPGPG